MLPTPPLPVRPLLLLDYDGTLAPLVADPAQAHPHPDVPALLTRLAALAPLYLLTGRDLAALGRLLVGARGVALPLSAIGLHGAEEGTLGGPTTRPAYAPHSDALARLRATVPDVPGVRVEAKGAGAFAVHYRGAPNAAAAHEALTAWAASAPEGLEPVWGKCVVELRPRGVSKGAAARRLAAAHPAHTPVMLGDDVTDEHAFEALRSVPGALTVRVGPGETVARYRLPDVAAAVAYLGRVAEALEDASASSAAAQPA